MLSSLIKNLLEDYNKNYSLNLSQEEIDQIMKDLEEQSKPKDKQETPWVIDFDEYQEWKNSVPGIPDVKTNGCIFHKWKEYVGLNEVYEYCEVCNEKRK